MQLGFLMAWFNQQSEGYFILKDWIEFISVLSFWILVFNLLATLNVILDAK